MKVKRKINSVKFYKNKKQKIILNELIFENQNLLIEIIKFLTPREIIQLRLLNNSFATLLNKYSIWNILCHINHFLLLPTYQDSIFFNSKDNLFFELKHGYRWLQVQLARKSLLEDLQSVGLSLRYHIVIISNTVNR